MEMPLGPLPLFILVPALNLLYEDMLPPLTLKPNTIHLSFPHLRPAWEPIHFLTTPSIFHIYNKPRPPYLAKVM